MGERGSMSRPGWESTAGEHSRRAKLTDAKVEEILLSRESNGVLAARHGVSAAQISRIRCGRDWSHVRRRLVDEGKLKAKR